MIRHFFLDKMCTIYNGCEYNTGNHPIMEITYGNGISRGILHFNDKELKKLVEDRTFPDINNIKVNLKLTNCANINGIPYKTKYNKAIDIEIERAISFDIILFKLPQTFDKGVGYSHTLDFWGDSKNEFSKDGCNWFKPRNGYKWEEEGIYSIETIKNEIEKYNRNEDSIIIGRQHFDDGLEMLDIDISKYVHDILNGEENHGIGISFSPLFETSETEKQQYIGFFTENTNLFFHPYIEVTYNDLICDNRNEFYLGKTNRLYLYASINGEMINFDEMPTCTINEVSYEVKQATKGIYYAEISTKNNKMNANTIYYDIWSNLSLNGQKIEDVEMEFVVLPQTNYLNIGNNSNIKKNLIPSVYGINDGEELNRGEVREVIVEYMKPYSNNEKEIYANGEYKIYVKDGKNEIDIFPYHPIEQGYLHNFFIVNTNDMIPNDYYIDIKLNIGREVKHYKEILRFSIENNLKDKLQ